MLISPIFTSEHSNRPASSSLARSRSERSSTMAPRADRCDGPPLHRIDGHGVARCLGDQGHGGSGTRHDSLDLPPLPEQVGGCVEQAVDLVGLGPVESVDVNRLELEVTVLETQQLTDELAEVGDPLVGGDRAVDDATVTNDELTHPAVAAQREAPRLGRVGDQAKYVVQRKGVDAALQSHGGCLPPRSGDGRPSPFTAKVVGTSKRTVELFSRTRATRDQRKWVATAAVMASIGAGWSVQSSKATAAW